MLLNCGVGEDLRVPWTARTSNQDPGWDGVYNGQLMPTTDYWYEITVHEIDKVYTGHFTLLRR